MNDYRELIELLAHPADGRDNADIMISAADAIEQLVKERDAYNRKAINAISDLRLAIKNGILTPCFYCKHGFPNWNEGCRQEPINGICGNWEWRGG